MVFNYLFRIIGGMNRAAIRFPFMVLMGVVISSCFSIVLELPEPTRNQLQKSIFEVTTVCAVGISLFFTAHLFAENAKNKMQKWGAFITAFGLLVLLYFTIADYSFRREMEEETVLKAIVFGVFSHMLAAFLPVKNRNNANAFWQYNKELFIRILTTALYSGVLFLGLAGAILAVDLLFKVEVDYKIYGHLWFWIAGAGSVFIFGSGIREDITDLEEENDHPKGLKLFAGYVLLPILVIYLIILYLYAGKILFTWELPIGWVGNLIMAFSVLGMLALLLLHPFGNDEGNSWIRRYTRSFYMVLLPLLVLLFVGIYVRIDSYGVTVVRYFLAALGVWLLFISLYMTISQKKRLWIIPASLGAMAFLVLYVPYLNAYSVAERSQTKRLHNYLAAQGMYKDGKLQPSKTVLTDSVSGNMYNIIQYLTNFHFKTGLEPVIKMEFERNKQNEQILNELGVSDYHNFKSDSLKSENEKKYLSEWESSQILDYQLKQYGIEYHYLRGNNYEDAENTVTDTVTATPAIEALERIYPKLKSDKFNQIVLPNNGGVQATYLLNYTALFNSQVIDEKLKLGYQTNTNHPELTVDYQGKKVVFKIHEHFEKIMPTLVVGSKLNISSQTYSISHELMTMTQGNVQLQFFSVPFEVNSTQDKKVASWQFDQSFGTNELNSRDAINGVSFAILILK